MAKTERRIQQNGSGQPPEPAGKLDVFHHRNIGETAQPFKNGCSNLTKMDWSPNSGQANEPMLSKTRAS
jgi:hypothetical protein